jgi:tetratricopeptide (TPR) repeat protein
MTEDEGQELDYRSLAEELKDRGNACFTAGDIEQAVNLYSQAIDIDPDNCVYYSNRSAAYMKADSKSKALKDAEKCLEIDPNFVKGNHHSFTSLLQS